MAGKNRQVSNEELLRAVALSPDPIVTAPEIADRVNLTRQGVNNRLPELVEQGLLKKRQVGAKAIVYWLTDEGRARAAEL
jgi:DNA-binding MarR family transcriptional regulator